MMRITAALTHVLLSPEVWALCKDLCSFHMVALYFVVLFVLVLFCKIFFETEACVEFSRLFLYFNMDLSEPVIHVGGI